MQCVNIKSLKNKTKYSSMLHKFITIYNLRYQCYETFKIFTNQYILHNYKIKQIINNIYLKFKFNK